MVGLLQPVGISFPEQSFEGQVAVSFNDGSGRFWHFLIGITKRHEDGFKICVKEKTVEEKRGDVQEIDVLM